MPAVEVTTSFSVGKGSQSITFPALGSHALNEGSILLNATASSALPVTYTSSDSGIAGVNGVNLSLFKAGSVTITASQSGDANWFAASPVSMVLGVTTTQAISLVKGWNWISFSLFPLDGSVTGLFSTYAPSDNDIILGTAGSATYYAGAWYPSSPDFTIQPWQMYKITSQSNTVLTASGLPAQPSNQRVFVSGWNWLGYPSANPRDITAALRPLVFSDDDYIQGQDGTSATYYEGVWYPNQGTSGYPFNSGKGYMLYLAIPQTNNLPTP
jgi:hypothetical protein